MKKYFGIALILQEKLCVSELLKDILLSNFFQCINHVGAVGLHSVISSGLKFWKSKFEKQTDSILFVCAPTVSSHKDIDVFDLCVPRRAQYLHEAWKKHQNAVYWVDINLAIKKGWTFYGRTLSFFSKHFQFFVFRILL